ncbi:MAG: type IV pilus modification protein PilV [Wenzhouxiangella sp.]
MPRNRQTRHQSGLTLLEVLIALLVLSIGLVGMASLHLTSLQASHSSYYRSIASTISLNIEERLWQMANDTLTDPGQCITDDLLTGGGGLAETITSDWRPGATHSSGWAWADYPLAGIPNVTIRFGTVTTGSITRPNFTAGGGTNGEWTDQWREVPLRITWTEDRFANDASNAESFDYTVRIPCVPEWDEDA